MNVLTVNYEFPPQGGGAGVVMASLVRSLGALEDVRQTVLAAWDARLGPRPALPGIDLQLVPVHRRGIHDTGARAVAEFLWRGGRAVRRLASAHDLVHFHFSVPTGLLAAVLGGRPYVCSLHGIDVPGYVREAELLQRLLRPANRRVLAGAARVFAPSRDIGRAILETCPQAAVEVIPHGVDVCAFQPKATYGPTARRFVTIARLTDWKRVHRAVEAVIALRRDVPDAALDVYGDGESRGEIERTVAAAGAGGYVRLRGFAPHETLRDTLREYDAFVLPSISEAFGLVFLEAMAAGLPVVGFDRGGPAEVIRPDVNGLLIRQDALADLVAAIRALATEPGLAERLGRNGRQLAVETFSWDRVALRYREAYRSVVEAARPTDR